MDKRVPVAVQLRTDEKGEITPLAIEWPDGLQEVGLLKQLRGPSGASAHHPPMDSHATRCESEKQKRGRLPPFSLYHICVKCLLFDEV